MSSNNGFWRKRGKKNEREEKQKQYINGISWVERKEPPKEETQ